VICESRTLRAMSELSHGSESCDARSALVFIVGLAAGTGCTIVSKAMFQARAVGLSGELEDFKPPLFQTWVMFLGMAFALPAHFIFEWRKRLAAAGDPEQLRQLEAEAGRVTARTYMLLAVPSLFDLIATVLMILGLLYVNASVWMLLRGGGIVFVALMKHFALQDTLRPPMWVGVFIIATAVVLVGLSSNIGAPGENDFFNVTESDIEEQMSAAVSPLVGVGVTMLGTFVQSVQYTYEEKVMSGDVSAPPWLLIGMEGVTGTLLSTFVLYPVFYFIPGDDHGSYEHPLNTLAMLYNSPQLLGLTLSFCVLVFILNSFSVLVTYMMSSVWHAILDNFRPITIWIVQLVLYYYVTDGSFGEAWTLGSYVQLAGMLVLLFGTAVYNGSIALPGLQGDALSLIGASSPMSSPALARSPLITLNRHSPSFERFDPGGRASPYVSRVRLGVEADEGSPMELGASRLARPLVVKSHERRESR